MKKRSKKIVKKYDIHVQLKKSSMRIHG
jgi:hypothetical protein